MTSLRDRNLRITVLKAIADAVQTAMADERATHLAELVDRYDDEGTKSFDVKLPSGVKVATITLSIPKDTISVADEAALVEWAKANAPHLVRERQVPEVHVPAHTVTELDPKAVTGWLKQVKATAPDGTDVVDTETGTLVDGVTHQLGGVPRSFSIRYADDGREAIAYAAGDPAVAGLIDDVLVLATPEREVAS